MRDLDIQRRDLARVNVSQRVGRVFDYGGIRIGRRQAHVRHVDTYRRSLGVWQRCRALGQRAVQRQGPGRSAALQLNTHVIERCAHRGQLADLQVHTVEQLFCTATRIVAGVSPCQRLPRSYVQFGQFTTDSQALGVWHDGPAAPQIQLAATVGKLATRRCKSEVRQVVVSHTQPALWPLQGHAKFARALLIGGFAERCGQIDCHALERGVDQQRAVFAVQGQLQLIRQVTRRWHWLGDAQPVRQFLHGDLPVCRDTRDIRARLAFGRNFSRHRTIERLCPDAFATQPTVAVETEVTLEPGQFQHRICQFQTRIVGAEIHHDLWLDALGQRNIQLELAFQRAFALPAGKRAARADGRLLKNLQAIDQASGKVTVHQQVAVLARRHVGNVDQHIADFGVEQLPLACLDPHAAVFNVHLAVHAGQRRPARLERQRCIADIEKQADDTRGVGRTLVQRTLVLEKALLDRTTHHGSAQPVIEFRAERGRQVFAGVATIAIDHADPQVHVVFLIVAEVNSDQEVRRDLAFIAQHLDIRRNQGERLIIQLPGQAGIGFLIAPRLGEDRVQVQHEVVGGKPQFALPQIATDRAADISGRRCAAIGIETDLVQIGGKTQALVAGGLRAVIEQYVAKPARHLEPVDRRHCLLRQRREGVDQWRERCQVQAVSLHMPKLFAVRRCSGLGQLQAAFPAVAAQVHRQ